jgi:hypothetical protein
LIDRFWWIHDQGDGEQGDRVSLVEPMKGGSLKQVRQGTYPHGATQRSHDDAAGCGCATPPLVTCVACSTIGRYLSTFLSIIEGEVPGIPRESLLLYEACSTIT